MRIKYDSREQRRARIEGEQYRKLWVSVLLMAVRDMNTGRAREARYWLFSNRRDIGSARWICDVLDIDLHSLQFCCMTREGRKKILGSSRDDV